MKKLLCMLAFAGFISQDAYSISPMSDPTPILGIWNGMIEYGAKSKQVELRFFLDDKGQLQCRWSVPETGIIASPLYNLNYNDATQQININRKFILGQVVGDSLFGALSAHGFEGAIKLKKSDESIVEAIEKSNIEFWNGEVKLSGSLIKPAGKGPFPAIVFVHGSGPGAASGWLYAARRLSKLGIACFIYDKRGSGQSEGNWVTSSLTDLAKDVGQAIVALQAMPEIDSERVGLWGHSQGGWIGPLTSALSKKVAFQVMVSGGGITPRDSEMYSYMKNLSYGNFDEKVIKEARDLINQYFEFLSTGENRYELANMIDEAKKKPWYDYINLHRVLVSQENQKNWSWVANYDPVEDISTLKEPVLVIYGGEDIIDDQGLSISRWLRGLKKAQNQNYQLEVFPKGNHGIRIGDHDSGPIFWQDFVEGYWETAESWLLKNVIGKSS